MKWLFIALCVFFAAYSPAQSVITGTILDSLTNSPLIGAKVDVEDLERSTTSDELGLFAIDIDSMQRVNIKISYVGYTSKSIEVSPNRDYQPIELHRSHNRNQITLLATNNEEQIGRVDVSVKALMRTVQFVSENDLMKSIQLLPSVTFGAEGSPSIYVKGGNADENMILLDDVPIYNIYHLYGIVSTIEPSIVNNTEVFTGAQPARYGGKLSSVINMKSSGAFPDKWEGKIGTGLLSSKIYLKGPLVKQGINVEFSARQSLVHLLADAYRDKTISKYVFSDYYGKIQFKTGKKGRLAFFYYQSQDSHKNKPFAPIIEDNIIKLRNVLEWANNLGGMNFHYQWSDNLFLKSTVYSSRFEFGLLGSVDINLGNTFRSAQYNSGIESIGYKQNFVWKYDKQKIDIGWDISRRKVNPGRVQTTIEKENEKSNNFSSDISSEDYDLRTFFEYDYVNGKFNFRPGINLVSHRYEGGTDFHIEPRLRFSYKYNDKTFLEATYSRMNQLYSVFSSTTIGLPTNSYVQTGNTLTNPSLDIVSLGIVRKISNSIKFQSEIYYKKSSGLNTIKPGSLPVIFGENWEDGVAKGGLGKAYGVEMTLTKHTGKLTGWLAYTLSKSTRQFADINNGEAFDFKYGRTNDIDLTLNYQFSRGYRISMNWVYATGQATTLPIGTIPSDIPDNTLLGVLGSVSAENLFSLIVFGYQKTAYNTFLVYNGHNAERFPSYHRMDLMLEKTWTGKHIRQSLQLSVYNVYKRLNTYFITVNHKGKLIDPFGKDFPSTNYSSVNLFPLIPSISYNLEF